MKHATEDQLSAVSKLNNSSLVQQYEQVKNMLARKSELHPYVQKRIDGMLESVEYEITKRGLLYPIISTQSK